MGNNTLSIGFFFAFMALTLLITYCAAHPHHRALLCSRR
jgi:hypothetical protein